MSTSPGCTRRWTLNALALARIRGRLPGISCPNWFILGGPSGTLLCFIFISTTTFNLVSFFVNAQDSHPMREWWTVLVSILTVNGKFKTNVHEERLRVNKNTLIVSWRSKFHQFWHLTLVNTFSRIVRLERLHWDKINTHCWNNHKEECKNENYLFKQRFPWRCCRIPESPYEGLGEG